MKPSRASALSLVAALVLPSLAFAVDPPPGGGYPHDNTALGDDALFSENLSDPNSRDNTGIGFQALYSLTTAQDNTAVGSQSLLKLTGGILNTAVGGSSLASLTTGGGNTAVGWQALTASTTGVGNTAVGSQTLQQNTTASGNTAVGQIALFENTTGEGNTALGGQALGNNLTGNSNTAVGQYCMLGVQGSKNTAIGGNAMYKAHGNRNIAVGNFAGQNFDGDNNIEIGNVGTAHDSNTIRIGDKKTQTRTFVAGISGVTVADGVAVAVNSQGQLGIATSSARYKDNIQPMNKASEALLSLKPVTFHYKKELDSKSVPQFGLVAEEVAKVAPELVARDEEGKPYTVRYEAVNAMLLNEFLKEHRKVESLERTVSELKAALQEQATQIQKVSALVQIAQPAPRVVANE